ncbi:MAG: TMEM175 family protein [Bacteroidia bacterium]
MNKTRLEAFSDGVIAIIITIMVLEIKIPHEATLHALLELTPVFISYVLSFLMVAIYWGNHHHLLHTVRHVTPKIIWANMGLLFSLSLVPFTTGWMGENHFAELTVALYAVNHLFCGFMAFILQTAILAHLTEKNKLMEALLKTKKKSMVTVAIYITAIPVAFYYPVISVALISICAVMWAIPDKGVERALMEGKE